MKKGFTLLELLVATTILSVISVVTTNILFETITTRSKQYSINSSNNEVRDFINEISKSIQEAYNIDIPNSNLILISGKECTAYKHNLVNSSIELATDTSSNCTPPTSGFVQVSSTNFKVDNLTFSPISNQTRSISLNLKGIYKIANQSHDVNFSTTVFNRLSI